MKKQTFLFIVLSISTINVWAQLWSTPGADLTVCSGYMGLRLISHHINSGDTTYLNGMWYTKIVTIDSQCISIPPPYYCSDITVFNSYFFLRESNDSLFFKPDTTLPELLVLKFNVEVGDTWIIPKNIFAGDTFPMEDSVYSVLIDDITTFNLGSKNFRTYQVSTNSHFFYSLHFYNDLFGALSLWPIYNNSSGAIYEYFYPYDYNYKEPGFELFPNQTSCYSEIMNILVANHKESIQIYPSPANNSASVIGNFKKFEIFNLYGEQISVGDLSSTSGIISTASIPNGIYFLRLDSLVTEKLVIQH